MKVLDLFAGTGGFSIAFSKCNHEIVLANDFCDESETIYKLNFPNHTFINKDLNEISSFPEHDILCGGFPCQPFSIAGKQEGFTDPRSNVFFTILEIMKKHNPKVVLLENVKNLLTHDNKNTFKVIKESIEKLQYHVTYKVLNTCEYTGIPQNRERIYIVCFKDVAVFNKFNLEFDAVPVKNVSEFLQPKVDKKYYYTSKLKVYDTVKKDVTKHISTNTVYQYRRYYIRENASGVCPTLTANMGQGGHNVPIIMDDIGIRKLTPRECFNLQGFPKEYLLSKLSDSKLYKLAGNAVSVPMIQLIVERITEALDDASANVP